MDRLRPSLRGAWPWVLLGLGLMLATEPVWRLFLLGFDPSLDALLELRCFPAGP